MVLNERPLPPTIPINLDLLFFNNCSALHLDITNRDRTFSIPSQIDVNFEPTDNFCHVSGLIEVPTIPASFHIGLGESYFGDNGVHQHLAYILRDRNVSHIVNRITFGNLSDLKSPIDNNSVILAKPTAYMITYFVQLVPVMKGGEVGFQTVASMAKTNLEKIRTKGIAGIVFEWNLAPIALLMADGKVKGIEIACHVMAMFGCAFVFVRFADYLGVRVGL
jgi:hypothetical protein